MPDNAAPLLLLTRPAPQSSRFAARFTGRIEVVIAPLQEIAPLEPRLSLDGVGALIFTSENGVRRFADMSDRRDLPVFCVGDHTAEVAQAAGLQARSAGGTAAELVALVQAAHTGGRVLHIHGRHTRGDVAGLLSAAGLEARGVATYEQRACARPAAFDGTLSRGRPVIAPLFSPRSADLFVKAMGQTRTARLVLPCLSQPVRAALPMDLQALAPVSETPDAAALTATIEGHFSP
ncbi:uroporphyrinogen-III synthase [Rhodophyticola sp. CCM32]|uniref:uroporphyrinogen-III synthase n=1 Tax=Rhodophyticola sp. CCM32 TaxID=2916397 RepID=UPI00107F05DC|nr:uroporphyrinogen-III synthase [Rhodophyticola sp. CCM32]QBY02395.1 uroporphyrinogen-III synthase [Rhodophyticola sp. CCM32]